MYRLTTLTIARLPFTAALAVGAQSAMAQSTGSIATMFANASTTWVALINLVVGASFLSGLFISCVALLKLKDASGGHTALKTPLWMAVIGAALIAMPAWIDTMTQTMSLGTNTGTQLLSEASSSSSLAGVSDAMNSVLLFVKLLGHIAFFRGLLMLKDYGSDKQGVGLGRGLTHLFGGAAAININATVSMLAATFLTGITLPGGLGSF
ncbi:hypothetical protein QZM81_19450 [Burkholderia cepacia]|uniref:hypothetical protein n=1 Tax=Burkholderia cepacia TaxID=292 RepID=UPI00264DAC22|nr:hypothetical protein [Burkholderia cepacia]MDN7857983.1 hypothetical protein [Burkholderia cepacia]